MSAVQQESRRVAGVLPRPGAPPRFEVAGSTLPDAPLVVALGGISADRHVCAHAADPRPGWWSSVAGDGRPLDTRRYRVLGIDFLDGGESADGRPERIVTTRDQADAIATALDAIGVRRAFAVIGASYGGMVALALAERHPERVERLVVIGASHRAHPLATAWRVVQRRVVELGLDSGRARDALILARALAMTTYRSRREFGARFDSAPVARDAADATFPVESYLRHQGERFAARFGAARFLALSLSSDLHSVEPALVRAPATIVAQEGDLLVPREDVEELGRRLGGPSRVVDVRGVHGHDGFLTEPEQVGRIIRIVLSTGTNI